MASGLQSRNIMAGGDGGAKVHDGQGAEQGDSVREEGARNQTWYLRSHFHDPPRHSQKYDLPVARVTGWISKPTKVTLGPNCHRH